MIVLKILLTVLGTAFMLFGYFIFFRKKYDLINGFRDDLKNGRKTEKYAERVGLAEFIIGIFLLIISFFLILFT